MADTIGTTAETGLAIPEVSVPANVSQSMDVFKDMAKSSDYFSRLQLLTGNSELVQNGAGRPGEYVLIVNKQTHFLLGATVIGWILGWRPKALRTGGDQPMAFFDVKSPEFLEVQRLSAVKDSGCMFGPEFLLYVAEKGFCTYHMASKTSRNVAPNVMALYEKRVPLALTSTHIKKPKFSWHGPVANESSVRPPQPEPETLKATLQKFLTPTSSQAEMADAPKTNREQ